MTQPLSRGQKAKLGDLTPATTLDVGVALAAPSNPTFDISCFGVDEHNQLSDDRYFVFYNQKTSPNQEIVALGAQGGDLEAFRVALAALPPTIQKLVFVATIDGAGTMRQLASGHLRLVAGGAEVARFAFSGADFGDEKAIILAEVYRKDVWRLAAVGQGFAGGLDALLAHFGGSTSDAPASASASAPASAGSAPAPMPAPSAAPTAPAPGKVNLQKRVALDKKIAQDAPQLVSLVKKAQITLEKKGLGDHAAKVALVLDISGSMSELYRSGKVQALAEKVLALGTRFDDDGAIDIFLFGERAHDIGEMSVANFHDFTLRMLQRHRLEGDTRYGAAMKAVREHYFPGAGRRTGPVSAPLPVYVMFVTDGQPSDGGVAREQLTQAAYEPIFWQFMGIGRSKRGIKSKGSWFGGQSDFAFLEGLDEMAGRYVDNANFFSVEDPTHVADEELYELLMGEYPDWVRQAPAKRLLP